MKIGILGAGGDISSGQYLARLYKGYPEAEFLAFEPSDNPEVFAKVQETIPQIVNHTSDGAVIDALSSEDYLFILSPSGYHADQLMRATSKAYKPFIICEKPVALIKEELERLIESDQRGKFTNTFFVDHWYPRMEGIKQMLRAGIGLENIKQTHLHPHLEISDKHKEYLSEQPISVESLIKVEGYLIEDSHLDTETNMRYPMSFMGGDYSRGESVFKYPNGVLTDTLIHPMNALCYALGIDGLTLQNIKSHSLLDRYGLPIERNDFQNGEAFAQINGNLNLPSGKDIEFDLVANKLAEKDHKGMTLTFEDGRSIIFKKVNGKDTTTLLGRNHEVLALMSTNREPYDLLIKDWILSGKVFQSNLSRPHNEQSLASYLNRIQLTNLQSLIGIQESARGLQSLL